MRLDVSVYGRVVAKLYRERDEYVLRYLPGSGPEDFVSLTMPVRDEPWRWPRDLHPFFRQNLPEGYLLGVIREEFGPLLDGTDLSLLAVVGATGIGRVSVTPEGISPVGVTDPLQIDRLMTAENTAELFGALVRRYARAAISGMVPKFIAPERASEETVEQFGKQTLRTPTHIIKRSDDTTPYLGFNEFYTMRVLERLGVVPVAKTRMSEDGRVLVVERFDVDPDGMVTQGLEDACGLLGLPPHEKYATTTEKVLNATRAYLPSERMRPQLERLGWLILMSYVVRNADFHAKNVALTYTSLNDVSYAPAYDIVTTQAYPRYASNPPALSIDGRQTWAAGKALERFFNTRLGISPNTYAEMVSRLCESAVEVGHEVIEAAREKPQWHQIAKQMLYAWNEGMASIRDPRQSVEVRGLDRAIAAAGFSEADPPEPTRVVIGRSELLANPRRKK